MTVDASPPGWLQWALVLVPAALLLSLALVAQTASLYWLAYLAAPHEIAVFVDAVEFSVQENESHDRDVAKVQRLEDKIRLARLLREIQRGGDDLREDLSSLFVVAPVPASAEKAHGPVRPPAAAAAAGRDGLRTSSRLLWAAKRARFEDRLRRLDLLRMRFLVVYLGIITSIADRQPPPAPPLPPPTPPDTRLPGFAATTRCTKPFLRKSLAGTATEPAAAAKHTPVRRLTTQAIGHQEDMARSGTQGWAGVVEELQLSPRMQQRHASVERSMSMTS